MLPIRWCLLAGAVAVLSACGGPQSRLIRKGSPGKDERVRLELFNNTGATIVHFYVVETSRGAKKGNEKTTTVEDSETWGNDVLPDDLPPGTRQEVPAAPGSWDVRPIDSDSRYQFITALKLSPGGRYELELNDGGWRYFEE